MLNAVPVELRAGDTWKWLSAFGDYPAGDGWQLATTFIGAQKLEVTATASNDAFLSIAASTDTSALTAGTYRWVSRVSKDGESYTVDSGTLEVLPDLAAENAGYDGRTNAEKQLAAAETALTNLLSKSHMTVNFGDQSFTLVDIEKLYRIRDHLRQQVATEKARANGKGGRRVLVRFDQP